MLCSNMTNEEKLLWEKLNKSQLGVRFKTQHPIDIFIVDFYCNKAKLAIEIDGKSHSGKEKYDIQRTIELANYGIKVVRFTNSEILEHLKNVIEKITYELKYILNTNDFY